MGVDYKKLEELRKTTRLTLLEKFRIMRMKFQAERDTNIVNQKEHCHLGVDWSEADEYEFQRRLERYKRGRGRFED